MIDALPPELEEFVQHELATRAYVSRADLVRDAVRQLRDRKRSIERLRAGVQVGRDQLDRGEAIVLDGDEALDAFFDDVQQRGQARYDAKHQAP